ncbi:hypothetical protein TeGR_g12189, partial [Tetraparma gracilis]
MLFIVLAPPETSEVCFSYLQDDAAEKVEQQGAGCTRPVSGIAQMRVLLPESLQHESEATSHTFLVTGRGTAADPVPVTIFLPPSPASPNRPHLIPAAVASAGDYASERSLFATQKANYLSSCVPTFPSSPPLHPDRLENSHQSLFLLELVFGSASSRPLTFVESGSADIFSSHTDLLERSLCWTGVGVEPIVGWAESTAEARPGMFQVHGALCKGGGPSEDFGITFVEDDSNPHLSGFSAEGEGVGTVCHHPTRLLSGLGLDRVDLFVLDCEGCELSVLEAFYGTPGAPEVLVDVWLVEGNDFGAVHSVLVGGGDYFLLTCVGVMDAVFVRKESDLWTDEMRRVRDVSVREKCN